METSNYLNKLSEELQKHLNQALQALIQKPCQIQLKQGGIVEINHLHQNLNQYASATAIYIPIVGDLKGDIFLFLFENSAHTLADVLLQQPQGTTVIFDELSTSAIKEIGNITTGVIITQLANMLQLSMMLTIPNIATDFATALVDNVLIDYGMEEQSLLSIELPFTIDEINVKGTFLILFDKKSSEIMRQKLADLANEGGHV